MTAQHIRETLLAANRNGVVWNEIVRQINVLAGFLAVSDAKLRRFAIEGKKPHSVTFYWLERWAEQREREAQSATAEGSTVAR